MYVFDAHDLQTDEQLESLLPGVQFGNQVPFVGLIRDGRPVEAAGGYRGRQLIARVLNIDEAALHQRITATVSNA